MSTIRKLMLWLLVLALSVGMAACGNGNHARSQGPYDRARESLVRNGIEAWGVKDANVLAAMRSVPRHLFVPEHLRGVHGGADFPSLNHFLDCVAQGRAPLTDGAVGRSAVELALAAERAIETSSVVRL